MRYSQKAYILIAGLVFWTAPVKSVAQNPDGIPTKEQQIQAAVSALPRPLQDKAGVLGYNQQGELVMLRKGSNEFICLGDDPSNPKFHVACYYREMEPFMKLGRTMRAEGKSRKEVDAARKRQIESGTLPWPRKPMALYNLSGPEGAFDYTTGKVKEATPLYVVYIPFATEKSTGISTSPAGPGAPWLMEAGEPWSHIMIPGQKVGTAVHERR